MRKLELYETDGFPSTRMQLIVSCTKVIQDYETLDYFFVATTIQGGRVQSNVFANKESAELNRDTMIGQNYMYWNEKEVAEYYKELFDFDEEVYILAVEEINDFRKTMKIYR